MHPDVAKVKHLSFVSSVRLGKEDQVMGTIFRKQIMSYGRWINPNWWWDEELWMELDEVKADEMIDNFNKNTYGKRISVPLNHTGDVNANTGWVVKLEKGDGGVWAYLDIRDEVALDKLNKGLIGDVSMGIDWDYVDQKNGDHHGTVLFHVALVTDPYLNDMDDFAHADASQLSREYKTWSENIGFGKSEEPSLIMMSRDKVKEFKRMKFSKIKNDKDFPVEVTYKDEDGKEVKATVEAGAEIEVLAEQEDAVKTQVSEAVAPASDTEETDEEKAARELKEQEDAEAERIAQEEADKNKSQEQKDKEELSRLRLRNSQLEADKVYKELLSKGKIVPAQKALFMSLALDAQVTLSKKPEGLKLGKGESEKNPSIITLLSAILEAGAVQVKLDNEQGKDGEELKVELSAEQEAKIKKFGLNVETFKKQMEKGNISLDDLKEK